MKRNTKVVLVLLLASLVQAGCMKQTVTDLPPGVTEKSVQNWYTAVGAIEVVTDFNDKAQQSVTSLNRAGVFPDGEAYATAQTAFGKVAQGSTAVAEFLITVPDHFDEPIKVKLLSYADTTLAEIESITANGLIGIKDEEQKRQVAILLNQIRSALALIKSLA